MDMYHRYFVYSVEQRKEKEAIAKKLGKIYTPGSVVVKGYRKPFTDVVLDLNTFRYSDVQIVITGDIRKINHTPPSNIS